MKKAYEKYIPFVPLKMEHRSWPDKQITKAPIWCSVDLRDGNQALVDPMNLQEKLEYFHTLVDIGVKEIEIGFPSASETEYEICRELIEGGHIPDDVTIQVLVQARPHLIQKTFEAIRGAKHVILHFYNSTSTLQRKVVFHMDMDGITKIATDAAKLIYELSQPVIAEGMDLRYEYSPESFMGTEMDYAVEICQAVIEAIHATPEKKIILNLPTTVENCMPNYFADELEYFISKLPSRDSAIISLHPHNDRGCGVATAEMGLLAGAERIEATLFGNGERTGNVDMVTLAMNMYTQGVDPELDFSDINKIKAMYERCTKMKVGERQPYAGELVFTAFSGSHQDAINKGTAYMEESGSEYWEIPYLPIDPADVGRQYEPIIRINSQSGKGGAPTSCTTISASTCPRPCTPSSATSSRWRPTGWAPSSSRSGFTSCSRRTTSRPPRLTSWCATPSPSSPTRRATPTSPLRAPSAVRAAPSRSTARVTAPSTPSSTPSTARRWTASPLWTTRSTPSLTAPTPWPWPTSSCGIRRARTTSAWASPTTSTWRPSRASCPPSTGRSPGTE